MSTRRPASRLATRTPAANGSNGERNSVVLGPNDRLVGQLFIEGDLRVSGTVDGELEATGDIEITGRVNGAVTAYNRLVVGSGGSLIGSDVRVARLTVEDGATLTGKISMGSAAVPSPKAVEPEPVPVVVEATPVVVKPEPAKPQAAKPEPVKPQAAKPEPVKLQAAKPEPVKPQTVKQQTVKPIQQKGKRR